MTKKSFVGKELKMRYTKSIAILISVFIGRCLFAAEPVPAEAAVRKADESWARAIGERSMDKTIAMYDHDAVTAGSAMFPARGIADFQKYWKELFAKPDFELTWKADKVVIAPSGSIAYTSGTWSMGKNGTGTYLAVWRKQTDGSWRVLVDAAWYAGSLK